MSLFLEPATFGEAKSTDTRAMGSWTDWRNFGKSNFQNSFSQIISIKKGVGENTRAFCLGRTESIPGVLYVRLKKSEKIKYEDTWVCVYIV